MTCCDNIWGVVKTSEPVFRDIIVSPTFQRLQGINLGPWCPNMPFYSTPISRYQHSIGVLMVLRIHGASVPEQIAGLIHDVSHTAFSHLSDRIFGAPESSKTQSYQDDIHESFVKNSELADIMNRHGYDPDKILDESQFKLKERELPDLCADRIDYSLRALPHMHQYGKLLDCDEKVLAKSFVATPNGFVMRDRISAQTFARAFNKTDEEIYSSYNSAFYEEMLAQICRESIARGILTKEDFFHMTDMQVIGKMHAAGVDFAPLYRTPSQWRQKTDQDGVTLLQKARRIDPPFLDENNNIQRLSSVDEDFAKYFAACPKYMQYKIKTR